MNKKIQTLDQIIYILTLCYAIVSCWALNTIPATFVSAALILGFIRHNIAPVKLSLEPSIKRAILAYWVILLLSAAAAYPDVTLTGLVLH